MKLNVEFYEEDDIFAPEFDDDAEVLNAQFGKIYGAQTGDHSKLTNRDLPDQHPIESITGLREALDKKVAPNIEDLGQNEVVIMDCGSSTEVI